MNNLVLNALLSVLDDFQKAVSQLTPGKDEWRSVNQDDKAPYYNYTRTQFGKILYAFIKPVFTENNNHFTPEEKMKVLEKYITVWSSSNSQLDIKDTEYADLYEDVRFGKYSSPYPESVPMLAGFDFQGLRFGNFFGSDLIFLSNNFKDADFSNTELPYTHFENCDFSHLKTSHTNLNQCRFVHCNMNAANLEDAGLDETCIRQSNITNMTIKKGEYPYGVRIDRCSDDNVKNKNCISAELNKELQIFEQIQHPYTPLSAVESLVKGRMNQLFLHPVTLHLLNSAQEETFEMPASDQYKLDAWLKEKLSFIRQLSPENAIDILFKLLEDPEVNYQRATSITIKDLAKILSIHHPHKLLNVSISKQTTLNYLHHAIYKAIVKLMVDTKIIDSQVEDTANIDILRLSTLINQLMTAQNALVKYNDRFSHFYRTEKIAALSFLINEKKLDPLAAILEIHHLSDDQTEALKELYDDGVRGKLLQTFKADKSSYFNYHHKNTLKSLIKEQHLTADQAMLEINGLTQNQADCLKDLYPHGLRGEHLLKWQAGRYAAFHDRQAETLKYLIVQKKYQPQHAISEIKELTSEQCQTLKRLYKFGLRGEALRKLPYKNIPNYYHDRCDALILLVEGFRMSVNKAVAFLDGSNDDDFVNKFVNVNSHPKNPMTTVVNKAYQSMGYQTESTKAKPQPIKTTSILLSSLWRPKKLHQEVSLITHAAQLIKQKR